jgi:hypothetical protein
MRNGGNGSVQSGSFWAKTVHAVSRMRISTREMIGMSCRHEANITILNGSSAIREITVFYGLSFACPVVQPSI